MDFRNCKKLDKTTTTTLVKCRSARVCPERLKILLIKNSFYLGQNSSRFMASKRLVCIFVHWGYLSSPLYMLADLASLIQSSLEDFPSLRLLHWSWFLPNHCTFECWLNWKKCWKNLNSKNNFELLKSTYLEIPQLHFWKMMYQVVLKSYNLMLENLTVDQKEWKNFNNNLTIFLRLMIFSWIWISFT